MLPISQWKVQELVPCCPVHKEAPGASISAWARVFNVSDVW